MSQDAREAVGQARRLRVDAEAAMQALAKDAMVAAQAMRDEARAEVKKLREEMSDALIARDQFMATRDQVRTLWIWLTVAGIASSIHGLALALTR